MKVYFKTVGCRVNQIESQSLAEKFASLGCGPAGSPEDADIIVVNSCSVTEYADRDTLSFIKRASASNPRARMIVTGCMATLAPERISAAAPAAGIFPHKDKEKIPYAVCGVPGGGDFFSVKGFAGRTRAFVKVQEGCDRRCSYCAVPLARGAMSSKPAAAALAEIRALAEAGFAEIVLCGTRLGMYKCPDSGAGLAGLMERLFKLPGRFRLRFSSLEPGEVSGRLAGVLKSGGDKFCDYFHLPLQSGSAGVLKDMGRPYGPSAYLGKLRLLREHFGEPGLYADVIAGYPTETEEQFLETAAFLRECRLAGLHVFRFSGRPGTRAHALKPLDRGTVDRRAAALRALDAELREAYARSMRGRVLSVLTLRNRNGRALGLASNFLRADLKSASGPGALIEVRITGIIAGGGAFVCSGEQT